MRRFPIYFQCISVVLLFMTAFGPAISMAGEPNQKKKKRYYSVSELEEQSKEKAKEQERQQKIAEIAEEQKKIRTKVEIDYADYLESRKQDIDNLLNDSRLLNARPDSLLELQTFLRDKLQTNFVMPYHATKNERKILFEIIYEYIGQKMGRTMAGGEIYGRGREGVQGPTFLNEVNSFREAAKTVQLSAEDKKSRIQHLVALTVELDAHLRSENSEKGSAQVDGIVSANRLDRDWEKKMHDYTFVYYFGLPFIELALMDKNSDVHMALWTGHVGVAIVLPLILLGMTFLGMKLNLKKIENIFRAFTEKVITLNLLINPFFLYILFKLLLRNKNAAVQNASSFTTGIQLGYESALAENPALTANNLSSLSQEFRDGLDRMQKALAAKKYELTEAIACEMALEGGSSTESTPTGIRADFSQPAGDQLGDDIYAEQGANTSGQNRGGTRQ